jgi:hypothetical protein
MADFVNIVINILHPHMQQISLLAQYLARNSLNMLYNGVTQADRYRAT